MAQSIIDHIDSAIKAIQDELVWLREEKGAGLLPGDKRHADAVAVSDWLKRDEVQLFFLQQLSKLAGYIQALRGGMPVSGAVDINTEIAGLQKRSYFQPLVCRDIIRLWEQVAEYQTQPLRSQTASIVKIDELGAKGSSTADDVWMIGKVLAVLSRLRSPVRRHHAEVSVEFEDSLRRMTERVQASLDKLNESLQAMRQLRLLHQKQRRLQSPELETQKLAELASFNTMLFILQQLQALHQCLNLQAGDWQEPYIDISQHITTLEAIIKSKNFIEEQERNPSSGFPFICRELLETWGDIQFQLQQQQAVHQSSSSFQENEAILFRISRVLQKEVTCLVEEKQKEQRVSQLRLPPLPPRKPTEGRPHRFSRPSVADNPHRLMPGKKQQDLPSLPPIQERPRQVEGQTPQQQQKKEQRQQTTKLPPIRRP